MLGFMPGFAYLGPLDESLRLPRRATPRLRVPAGSVAIAGEQTAVYPLDTPGGWWIIGRTSLRVFDPERDPPVLFDVGRAVRFEAR
jgi:KipI family sensor histidine kinase inhibitor